jgi:hypothetical protein
MPRKATGTIARAGDHWKARLHLADGSRSWVDLPLGLSEAKAREMTAALAERARSKNWKAPPKNGVLPPPGSTVADWSKRWLAHRTQRGLTSVRDAKVRPRRQGPLQGHDLEDGLEHLGGPPPHVPGRPAFPASPQVPC